LPTALAKLEVQLDHQFEVGVKAGAEGIDHTVRPLLSNFTGSGRFVLKVDLKNALNSVSRAVLLKIVQ
jgi:hypothetical protein